MQKYIALLRGINVSGQKKIKMADLRTHIEALGFKEVQTYIQSGNVVFQYKKSAAKKLEEKIEQKIFAEYGFEVPVLIKTPEEFKDILEHNPFADKDSKCQYFTLLSNTPLAANLDKLKQYDYSPEEYLIKGTTVYFHPPNGYGRAKMNNNFFENKLKVRATTRNLKTMNVLLEMTLR